MLRKKITARAAIQRVNRKLKAKQQVLKKSRTDQERERLGGYYLVDRRKHGVVERYVILAALCEQLRAVETWEDVIDPYDYDVESR